MTFTQVDDAWPDSPDVLAVSRSARLLEIEGKCYGNRHLTDGRITRAQWLRATDTDTFDQDLTELIEARLVDVIGPDLYQLDWSQQQTREQVLKARARRRADNERRARALELHKDGDHSLCTHAGGGRARQTGETSSTESNGPSTRKSTKTSTGPSKPRKNGRSNGASSGRSVVGSPAHPSPAQPSRSGTEDGGDGLAADASAGAPASAAGPSAAESPQVARPAVVTLADLPEAFQEDGGEPRSQEELDYLWEQIYADPQSRLFGRWRPSASGDAPDHADTLDGLVAAGGGGLADAR